MFFYTEPTKLVDLLKTTVVYTSKIGVVLVVRFHISD